MIKILVISLIVLIPLLSFSQRWKRYRYEVVYGAGVTNFFGDLGGSNSESTFNPLSIRDFDVLSSRYNVFVGARYKIVERLAIKANLVYANISGSDFNTDLASRAGRGLSFSSPIYEFSGQVEFSIFKERFGRKYTIKNISRAKLKDFNSYFLIGGGVFSFNPKPKKFGEEIPVGDYSKINYNIPVGMGVKYGINRDYSFGVEVANRFTFTDYIDNHKDTYSKANDSYLFIMFNVSYKLKTSRSGLPKF